MSETKTRRIYRLRVLLAHVGACCAWRRFVRRFETAADVLAAVNTPDARGPSIWSRPWSVRWIASAIAVRLSDIGEDDWWTERRWRDDSPITAEEAERFRALWVRYADAHGLYEEVPA